ncbi:MAG: ribosome maturation factor RimP [Armatimonadota bacterium]|jgi:ribosome maturation factor RimP
MGLARGVGRIEATIAGSIEELLGEHGYELVELKYSAGRRRASLTVFIDKPDGVTTQDCETMSRQIGLLMDALDPIARRYDLIVSSPGIERPLRKPEHYDRFRGKLAAVRIAEPDGRRRTLQGRLAGFQGQDVLLEVDGQVLQIPVACVEDAHLVFDWDAERARVKQ